jgi:hypothetical protein
MSEKELPPAPRRFGYLMSILVNLVLIYVVNNLQNWHISFLTDRFSACLWAIDLSLGASIFVNFIFLFFDRRWFRNLMQSLASIFSLISIYIFWRVFPLDISASTARLVNFGLIILLVLTLISILSEVLNSIRHYRRNPME